MAVGELAGLVARLRRARFRFVQHDNFRDHVFPCRDHMPDPRRGRRRADDCGRTDWLSISFQKEKVDPSGLLRTPAERSMAERESAKQSKISFNI